MSLVGGCRILERCVFSPTSLCSRKYKLEICASEKETEMKTDRLKTSLVLLLLGLVQNVVLNFKLRLTLFSRCHQIKSHFDTLVRCSRYPINVKVSGWQTSLHQVKSELWTFWLWPENSPSSHLSQRSCWTQGNRSCRCTLLIYFADNLDGSARAFQPLCLVGSHMSCLYGEQSRAATGHILLSIKAK